MANRRDSSTFEIVVVLAIVAMVAVTGQVLIYYDGVRSSASPVGGPESGSLISGFVVAGDAGNEASFTDISVEKIEVNPASPLLGDPFEIKVTLKNKGTAEVSVPFYLQIEIAPKSPEAEVALPPGYVQGISTQILEPGDETVVSALVTTIMPEGPLRITAYADSTFKLDDQNLANNQLSKTIIVATE